MINQHGTSTRVVDQFDATDLGAPFKVVLKDAVRVVSDTETGEVISYTIPDPDGLLRVVTLSRVLHPRKLSGADIKFLRKAVGLKQKDLAQAIELSPEHLSKVESGALPIGPASEKLMRIFLIKTSHKHHQLRECDRKELESALDQLFDCMTPIVAYSANEQLVFSFVRTADAGADDGCWDKLDLAA